jgi:hypothetical protein
MTSVYPADQSRALQGQPVQAKNELAKTYVEECRKLNTKIEPKIVWSLNIINTKEYNSKNQMTLDAQGSLPQTKVLIRVIDKLKLNAFYIGTGTRVIDKKIVDDMLQRTREGRHAPVSAMGPLKNDTRSQLEKFFWDESMKIIIGKNIKH